MNAVYQMQFPQQFVFGKNAMRECSKSLMAIGSNFLFVLGCGPISDNVKNDILNSFSENKNVKLTFLDNDGEEVCERAVNELADYAEKIGADVIIGIGGGKALDLVRAVSFKVKIKVALFPTAASSNAPGTRFAVMYDESTHTNAGVLVMNHFPELILADTSYIVMAPERMLAAGIGDSLGFVIESMFSAKRLDQKTTGSASAWNNVLKSGEILFNQGTKAYYAAKNKCVNKDFNDVVEQIVFWNGVYTDAVGAVANLPHLIESIMPVEPHRFMHGEMIGYCTIPLLVMEGVSLDIIHKYIDFCLSIHLPVNFEQLGIKELNLDALKQGAAFLTNNEFVDTKSLKLDAESLYQNILVAEDIVNSYLNNK